MDGRWYAAVVFAASLAGSQAQEDAVGAGNQPGPQMPFSFVENQGQWPEGVLFQARARDMVVRVVEDGVLLRLRSGTEEGVRHDVVKMAFGEALDAADVVGCEEQGGRYNFFLGKDPEQWRTGVPGHDQVLCRGLCPGVDLRLRGQDGCLEYDLLLEPGASLDALVLTLEGVDDLCLDGQGALVLTVGDGTLVQAPPVTWQVDPEGQLERIESRYRLLGDRQFGFVVPGRDPTLATVVDPRLEWSTFFGGAGVDEYCLTLGIDDQGKLLVGGQTDDASGFWTTPGSFSYGGGPHDAWLAQFDPSEAIPADQLKWCTYLGGDGDDLLESIVPGPNGTVYGMGTTTSTNLPVVNALQATYQGGPLDLWMFCLDASTPGLFTLSYLTYLGGDATDNATGLHLDTSGILSVVGWSDSTNFPTTANAWSKTLRGYFDIVICRIDPSQAPASQLLYGTYLGGTLHDQANGMAVDDNGVVATVGWTYSINLPVTPGAFANSYVGPGSEGFLLTLDPGLSKVQYGTYLGGPNAIDTANGVAVGSNGTYLITGSTDSYVFPTTNGAFSPNYNGGPSDAFLSEINPAGQGQADLVYSTYLGGGSSDRGYKLVVDTTGGVTVVGYTSSSDFPTTPYAFDPNPRNYDTFISRLSLRARGAKDLISSTALGAYGFDEPWAVTVDAQNLPIVVGRTSSGAFPTTNGAFQVKKGAGSDGYITHLWMVSWSNYGAGWPGTGGQVPGFTASEYPVLGSSITLDAENSSGVNTVGILLVGLAPANATTPRGGTILVTPSLIQVVPVPAAGLSLPWAIPNDPNLADLEIFLQVLESDPGAVGGISMTPGLDLILGG